MNTRLDIVLLDVVRCVGRQCVHGKMHSIGSPQWTVVGDDRFGDGSIKSDCMYGHTHTKCERTRALADTHTVANNENCHICMRWPMVFECRNVPSVRNEASFGVDCVQPPPHTHTICEQLRRPFNYCCRCCFCYSPGYATQAAALLVPHKTLIAN